MSTVRMSKGLFVVATDGAAADADDARFAADFRSRRIILCVVVAAVVRAFFLVGDDDMMILYIIQYLQCSTGIYIYINDVGMIRFSVVDCTPYSLFSVGGGLTGCHCSRTSYWHRVILSRCGVRYRMYRYARCGLRIANCDSE